jgi:hypothetical protein
MKLTTIAFELCILTFLVGGCSTIPLEVVDTSKPIQFLDLPSFDDQMKQALRANPEEVKIEILDKVKPSQMPERLKQWVAAAQKSGGNVQVTSPENEPRTRGLPMLSLLPAVFSALRQINPFASSDVVVKGYDVQIQLKSDGSGDRTIESFVFRRRAP